MRVPGAPAGAVAPASPPAPVRPGPGSRLPEALGPPGARVHPAGETPTHPGGRGPGARGCRVTGGPRRVSGVPRLGHRAGRRGEDSRRGGSCYADPGKHGVCWERSRSAGCTTWAGVPAASHPWEGLGGGAAGRRRGALVSKGWGEAYGGRGGSEPGSSPGPGTLLRRSPRFGDPAAAEPGARAPGLRGQLRGRVVRAERDPSGASPGGRADPQDAAPAAATDRVWGPAGLYPPGSCAAVPTGSDTPTAG